MDFAGFLDQYGWLVSLGGFLVGALLLHAITRLLLGFLAKRWKKKNHAKHVLLTTFPTSAALPLVTLIWVLAAIFALEVLFRQWVGFEHPLPLIKARQFAVVSAAAWWLLRWNRIAHAQLRHHVDKGEMDLEVGQLDLVAKLVTLLVLLLGALLLMQIAGVDIRAIVTLGGFGAVALGFAGKDVFANFFSGMMIHATKPFCVGEAISVSDKNISGVVEAIGWYMTSLRGLDKRPVYAPNALFCAAAVVNISRMTHRLIEFKLPVRFGDLSSVQTVCEEMRGYLQGLSSLDQSLTPLVWLTDYGPSSLNIFIRCYTVTTNWLEFLRIQQEVLTRCAQVVEEQGATMAAPVASLELPPLKVELSTIS